MIRVGLVTTWGNVRCGVAEYSRMLMENMPADAEIEFTPIAGPYEVPYLLPRVLSGQFDIIHFNYDSGFLGIFAPGVAQRFREHGAKLVLTLNDHHPRNNRTLFAFVSDFDRVVVHQETGEGFTHIPIGVPTVDPALWSPHNTTIGTSGFPLPQKAVPLVAAAAAILVQETPRITGCTIVCPESQHVNTHEIARQCRALFPSVNYITDWLPQERVMEILATNLVNVYPMRDGKSGISSSVRMGVGTGSHMVLSRSWMFEDWRDHEPYASEVEWIDGEPNELTPRAVADAVLRVLDNGRRPNKILEDMAWTKSARAYADLYHSLVGRALSA